MAQAEVQEITCKSLLNRIDVSGFPFRWTLNPYRGCRHACRYCYARPTHEFWGMNSGNEFDQRVFAKVNAPEVLREELRKPRWRGEPVAIGTASDPYEPAEAQYRLTRQIIQVLAEFRNPASITTKGVLARRDVDVLLELYHAADVQVIFSVGSVDESVWKRTEPGTPKPHRPAGGHAVPGGKRRPCRSDDGAPAARHLRQYGGNQHHRAGGGSASRPVPVGQPAFPQAGVPGMVHAHA